MLSFFSFFFVLAWKARRPWTSQKKRLNRNQISSINNSQTEQDFHFSSSSSFFFQHTQAPLRFRVSSHIPICQQAPTRYRCIWRHSVLKKYYVSLASVWKRSECKIRQVYTKTRRLHFYSSMENALNNEFLRAKKSLSITEICNRQMQWKLLCRWSWW